MSRIIVSDLRVSALALALLAGICLPGCKDPDLAVQIPPVAITTVETPYGLTLDESSPPTDVGYVFLQTVRDDFSAAKDAEKREEQKAAFALQTQLAAANRIQKILQGVHQRDSLPVEFTREEAVYKVARTWTPTVAYYIDNFQADRHDLVSRMHKVPKRDGDLDLWLDVEHGTSGARLSISLTREPGDENPDQQFWRIFAVGFVNPKRSTAPQTTQPAAAGAKNAAAKP